LISLAVVKELIEGVRCKLNELPEIYLTIQKLDLQEGGVISFTPSNFALKGLKMELFLEFVGSMAQFASAFALNPEDKIVANALHPLKLSIDARTRLLRERITASESRFVNDAVHIGQELVPERASHVAVLAKHQVDVVEDRARTTASIASGTVKSASTRAHHARAQAAKDGAEAVPEVHALIVGVAIDLSKQQYGDRAIANLHDLYTDIKVLRKALRDCHWLRKLIEHAVSYQVTEILNEQVKDLSHTELKVKG
jgi:hypothetical protein